jgi:hypothetical protein
VHAGPLCDYGRCPLVPIPAASTAPASLAIDSHLTRYVFDETRDGTVNLKVADLRAAIAIFYAIFRAKSRRDALPRTQSFASGQTCVRNRTIDYDEGFSEVRQQVRSTASSVGEPFVPC